MWTGLERRPSPSSSTVTVAPGTSQAAGVCIAATPAGVPVAMTSPGSSGMRCEMYETSSAMSNSIVRVEPFWTLQGVEKVIEAFGGKSAKILSMGGQPETNPLGDTYFSQAAIRFGAYIAKVSVAPVSDSLRALTDAKVDLKDRPNGLREAVVEHFDVSGGEWEMRVQLCTDLETMPIEDASVEWPEDKSPYVAVARITAAPQVAWSAARGQAVDDGILFSPWHGLAAHRPLGAVMRARKTAYEMSARFRTERNGRAVEEPRDLDSLPD